jgi:hypothetical protein
VVVDEGVKRHLHEQIKVKLTQHQERVSCAFRSAVGLAQHGDERPRVAGGANRLDESRVRSFSVKSSGDVISSTYPSANASAQRSLSDLVARASVRRDRAGAGGTPDRLR